MSRPDLGGLRVAITGERRAAEQAALVTALGGEPLVCPTVRVAWEEDPGASERWAAAVLAGIDDAVFMTGMGTNRLLADAASAGRLEAVVEALRRARIVVRGSKARPVLGRHGLGVDLAPQPATTAGVLGAMGPDLRGRRIALQLAGPEPSPLADGLRAAGAQVTAVCIYRYPADAVVGAAGALLDAILDGGVDAVTFTSAPAVEGLIAAATAREEWPQVRHRLGELIVAAVGPVTAAALAAGGVAVDVEPEEPRMGPMMRELAETASRRRPPRRGRIMEG
jgi:uroporphyrinogen-III synthase